MTREDAIRILEDERYVIWESASEKTFAMTRNEAFDMAVDALSVDLVRCKDCKHGKVETEPRRPWEGDITCKLDCTDREWYKGDYCSYGERRSDETEDS